ncbi:MAG: hypothetical protein WD770_09100 [Actinomycetota bacterium]
MAGGLGLAAGLGHPLREDPAREVCLERGQPRPAYLLVDPVPERGVAQMVLVGQRL